MDWVATTALEGMALVAVAMIQAAMAKVIIGAKVVVARVAVAVAVVPQVAVRSEGVVMVHRTERWKHCMRLHSPRQFRGSLTAPISMERTELAQHPWPQIGWVRRSARSQ